MTLNELKWFESYLQNRKQKTKFRNKCSSEKSIPIGLPQGTALSVLLFVLYINDIVSAPEFAKIKMFADDTTVTIKAKDIETAIRMMNSDLNRIYKWLNINKLKLNIEKTKWMLFANKTNITIIQNVKIGANSIERVNKIKYLGVIINEKLKPNDQIQKCVAKAASKVNMLKRISNKLTFETRKIIYNTIVQPNFDYCASLYLNASKEQIKSMQKIQNRGMRSILKCDYFASKKFMLNSLQWLSIAQRIKFNVLIMIFKIKNGMVPDYILNEVRYVSDVSSRTLRNQSDFSLPNYKSNTTRNSIYYEGLKLYNQLPNDIKNCKTLLTFKLKCKKYVSEQIPIS